MVRVACPGLCTGSRPWERPSPPCCTDDRLKGQGGVKPPARRRWQVHRRFDSVLLVGLRRYDYIECSWLPRVLEGPSVAGISQLPRRGLQAGTDGRPKPQGRLVPPNRGRGDRRHPLPTTPTDASAYRGAAASHRSTCRSDGHRPARRTSAANSGTVWSGATATGRNAKSCPACVSSTGRLLFLVDIVQRDYHAVFDGDNKARGRALA